MLCQWSIWGFFCPLCLEHFLFTIVRNSVPCIVPLAPKGTASTSVVPTGTSPMAQPPSLPVRIITTAPARSLSDCHLASSSLFFTGLQSDLSEVKMGSCSLGGIQTVNVVYKPCCSLAAVCLSSSCAQLSTQEAACGLWASRRACNEASIWIFSLSSPTFVLIRWFSPLGFSLDVTSSPKPYLPPSLDQVFPHLSLHLCQHPFSPPLQ